MMLGEKLRKQRRFKNLTLEKLAVEAETTKGYVWELEKGKTSRPSAKILSRIARVLEITIDYLMDDSKKDFTDDDKHQYFLQRVSNLNVSKRQQVERFLNAIEQ